MFNCEFLLYLPTAAVSQLSKPGTPFYYQQVSPLNSINEGNLALTLLDMFCNCWLSKLLLMILLIVKWFQIYSYTIDFFDSNSFLFAMISFLLRFFNGLVFNTWIKLTFEASVHLCSFYLCTLQISLLFPWEIWHSTQIPNKNIFKNFSPELQELPL